MGKRRARFSVSAIEQDAYDSGGAAVQTDLLAVLNRMNVPAAKGLNPETDDIVEVAEKTFHGMISAFKELSFVMEAQRNAMEQELMNCKEPIHEPFKKALREGANLAEEEQKKGGEK